MRLSFLLVGVVAICRLSKMCCKMKINFLLKMKFSKILKFLKILILQIYTNFLYKRYVKSSSLFIRNATHAMDDHLLYDEDQQKMRIDEFFEDFVPKGVDTLDRVNALLKALNIAVDVEHEFYNAKKTLYYYGRSKFTFDVTSSKLANRDTERVNESRVYMIDALKCWDPKKETFNLKKLVKRQLPEFLGGPKLEPAVIRDGNVNGGGATSSSKKTKPSVDTETQKRIDSMTKPILEGIRVGYGIKSGGPTRPDLVRVIVDSCSNEHRKRNANCHVGADRKMTRDDPKLALYTLSEYIWCWDPESKEFHFSEKDQELTPEPQVEARVEKSVNAQHQGGLKITAVPRSVRNKHVLNRSDSGTLTSISVTDNADTHPKNQDVPDSQPEACSGDAEEETLSSSNGSTGQGTLSPSNDSVEQYEFVCKCWCVPCECYRFDKDGNQVY